MNLILDRLFIQPKELALITEKYPACKITKLGGSDQLIQQFRVNIKDEVEEAYFDFLVDNAIAMSSNKFYFRVKSDIKFADRMNARISQVH